MAPHLTPVRTATKTRQRLRVSAKHYDSAHWNTMQSIITQLYYEDKVSIAELLLRLHAMGFEVKYVNPSL